MQPFTTFKYCIYEQIPLKWAGTEQKSPRFNLLQPGFHMHGHHICGLYNHGS